MNIRDRIVGIRRVPARDLRPNPANWRKHPQAQQDALRGILSEIGYVDALLALERDGGYMLLDGHLRAETTLDTEVPVLVVDLTDEEAAKVLATFDPLSAMAEPDALKLDALLREVDTGSAALQEMLAELAEDAGLYAGKLEEGWGQTEENEASTPNNVVCFLGLNVGDVTEFEKTLASVAMHGETPIQTILRGLDALHAQGEKSEGQVPQQERELQDEGPPPNRVRSKRKRV